MTFDNTMYPEISLPPILRMWLLWTRLMRFAAFPADQAGCGSVALEREFMALISREAATISKICFSYSCSAVEFDDLRQDALINIWRGLQSFKGKSAEKTWVYRVTVNSCISSIRKQSRHQHESLDGLYGLMASDESDKEDIQQLHRVISGLGVQEKAIIMMWLDDLGYDDIAAAMGLNRNTVATKIRRIKDKIARQYKSI